MLTINIMKRLEIFQFKVSMFLSSLTKLIEFMGNCRFKLNFQIESENCYWVKLLVLPMIEESNFSWR